MTENSLVRIGVIRDLAAMPEGQNRANLLAALDVLDLHGGPKDIAVDAQLSDALWRMAQQAESISWIDQCYLIHRLRQKVQGDVWIDGELRTAEVERWQTWESVAAQEQDQAPNYEWGNFCRMRLNMDPGKASGLKRIWEVFHLTLGTSREKLERAGKSALRQAVGQVARDWQAGGVDDDLMALLFGLTWDEMDCDLPEEQFPSDLAVEPATFAEVDAYVNSRAATTEPGEPTSYEFRISGDENEPHRSGPGTLRIVTCWMRRPGEMVAEPFEFAAVRVSGNGLTDEEKEEAWALFRRRIR